MDTSHGGHSQTTLVRILPLKLTNSSAALEENRLLLEIVDRMLQANVANDANAFITLSHAQRFQDVQNSFTKRVGNIPFLISSTQDRLEKCKDVFTKSAEELMENLNRDGVFVEDALNLRRNGWILQPGKVIDYSFRNCGSVYPELGEAVVAPKLKCNHEEAKCVISVGEGDAWIHWERLHLWKQFSTPWKAQTTLFHSELFATVSLWFMSF